jgi:hypothetical protein
MGQQHQLAAPNLASLADIGSGVLNLDAPATFSDDLFRTSLICFARKFQAKLVA